MYLLYNLALLVYFAASLPRVGYRMLSGGKSPGRIADRLGRPPLAADPAGRPAIWIHAVSVGEALAARPLVNLLSRRYPDHRLLVSTTTATGQQVAQQLRPAADAVFYAPLDLPACVAGTLDRVAPRLLVLVDTEIWPNLLRACRRRGVRIVIVNGRLSDRSLRGYRLVRGFMRRVLAGVDRVCAQDPLWAERFTALGLPRERIAVTGSLKFDAAAGVAPEAVDALRRRFAFAAQRPVIIAASTLRGEEQPVLRAFARVRRTFADALLIMAPRRPERFAPAAAAAAGAGFAVVLRSDLDEAGAAPADVVVLDTLGELPALFPLATVVFVGGSLVPAGGHNVLEPAACGRPILFGPHMRNFAGVVEPLLARGGAREVRSTEELGAALETLLGDAGRRAALGAAARALVDSQQGAASRTLDAIGDLLPPPAATAESPAGAAAC